MTANKRKAGRKRGDQGRRYRVIGHNLANGRLSQWYYDSVVECRRLAEILCAEGGRPAAIVEVIGEYVPTRPPVKYVPLPTKRRRQR